MKFNTVKVVSGISGFEGEGKDYVNIEIEGTFKYHKQAAPLCLAAPELLEALELAWCALMKSNKTPVVIEALNKATEALKKAKGE